MKPFIVYDIECQFCLERVQKIVEVTDGVFDYGPWQDPEIRDRFDLQGEIEEGIRLVEDGRVSVGPDASYRIARHLPGWRWVAWIYLLPGIKQACRYAYRKLAERRKRMNRPCAGGFCRVD